MARQRWLTMLLIGGWMFGCAKDEGTALDRDAFYRPPPGTSEQRHVLRDEPAPPNYDHVRVDLMDPRPRINLLPGEAPAPQESVTTISDAVREVVDLNTIVAPGSESNADAPAQAQLTPRPGVPSGVAMLIGGVVCEVNGNPIYADKLLASLSKVLQTEARSRDERAFRAFAQREIEKQLNVLISAELEFAVAQRNLDFREKQLAEEFTARWRQQQITQAGGSLQRARAKAAADGWDFDEMVAEEFRNTMVRIYYQKKILPQAQVTADDIRRYYHQHVRNQFTQPDQARFRVIKIDIRKTGSEAAARDKIDNLRQRALRGEDFASLASSFNDDAMLMRSGGDVGWIQRGAYRLDALEQEVWKVQIGDVTDVVRIDDAFYIARLEERKFGRVQQFEEQSVQDRIADTLRKQQIALLRDRQRQALIKDAVIYPDPPDIAPVVEMAMQQYWQWVSLEK